MEKFMKTTFSLLTCLIIAAVFQFFDKGLSGLSPLMACAILASGLFDFLEFRQEQEYLELAQGAE
jgi:hypothetical protein